MSAQVRWLEAVLAVVAAGVCTAAFGEDGVGQIYVTPKVGHLWTDHSRLVDDDLYYGGAIGVNLSRAWSAEINVLTGDYDGRRRSSEQRLTAVSLDALRVLDRGSPFAPYLTAGLGVMVTDPQYAGPQDSLLLQGGVGAFVHLWSSASGGTSLSLVPEVKVRWDTGGDHRRPLDLLAGVGLQLSFGRPRPVAVLPPAPPRRDDAPPPPSPPTRVEPPPPPPAPAPLRGAITLEGVHFETASARLTADSGEALDKVAASLRAYPGLQVEVQGHTDAVGAAGYNLTLSQARAESVREYLVKHGVGTLQLTARGYGKMQPIADNGTAQGRARNRRVVLVVLSNPDDVDVRRRDDR